MRIVFMGTPVFAVPVLSELVGQGHEVAAVYTRAPTRSGRGMAETPSPVHALASRLGLPVLHPASLKGEDAAAAFRSHEADLAVVVAYGLRLPQAILDAPRLGCVNLHGSILPRWRGAAPIQRAVMAGDAETGVAVMRMEAGLDTGPVGMEERLRLTPDMTAGDLHDRLAPIGADLMGRAVGALERGTLQFRAQPDEGVTYARKIEKAEARIDWSRPAPEVLRHLMGLSPFPGAFFEADLGHGPERVKVLRARLAHGSGTPGTALDDALTVACGAGAVALTTLQRAGKAPLSAAELLRGRPVPSGTRLG
ncbi:methionyl-tRNA formyltransferase [Lichenibacterium minor]|uniref:Methionyl-tRNA formyltransferase n=1 Tax=Lichenibacterium minor TaxID=2316528 RepID=A0A4Q2U275_9HYPH|nr:methionyl-tRNA formyltransferase [Lichenibacterium minor]RYC30599.1 methionyl-tRNA formyltransferase [Lichenibacterium minor]